MPLFMKTLRNFSSMLAILLSVLCVHQRLDAQVITLNYRDVPLEKVLKSITEETGYKFIYSSSVIDVKQKTSINIRSGEIKAILDTLFASTNITYSISHKNKQVALFLKSDVKKSTVEGKLKTIKGRIVDNEGLPIAGVYINELGSNRVAVSNEDGEYSITVKDDPKAILVFKCMGVKEHMEPIYSRDKINISLEYEEILIAQLVVTGYQSISKERSAGSYSIVRAEEFQDKAIAKGSLLESMEGIVAGFNINLGSEGDKFLIRGLTSINSTRAPLFIVDGVPVSSEMLESILNKGDVDNVTVLKDATAASIWGSQAANGVVVISTKKGSRNTNTSITYNGSFTYEGMPDYSYNDLMNSKDFIRNVAEEFDPVGYPWESISTGTQYAVLPHEMPLYKYYNGEISKEELDRQLQSLSKLDGRKDYEDHLMSNSWVTNHSVSLSGGSNNQSYYLSFGYQGHQGSEKNRSDEYRINAREVLDITRWMSLDLSLNASYKNDKQHLTNFTLDENPGLVGLSSLPYSVFYDSNSKPLSFTHYLMNDSVKENAEEITGINLDYYPINDFNNTTQESVSSNIRANAGLSINLLPGLKYEGRFSYYMSNGNRETYTPSESYNVRLDRVYATTQDGISYLPSSGGYFSMYNSREDSYTLRNQLNFDRSFGDNRHIITAIAGHEIRQTKIGYNNNTMRGYDKQTMQSIFFDDYYINVEGVENPIISKISSYRNMFDSNRYSQGENTYRYLSFYVNAAYTFNQRYSINASTRLDQSNLFGSDPSVQFKPIWSVGGIWNLGKEEFLNGQSWIDGLDFRASYGYAGNSPSPGQGGPFNIISAVSDPVFSDFGLGYVISTPANNKLTWEKTRTINFGLSYALFNSRLSGSIDVYDKKTTDLLALSPINPSTGYSYVFQNIGEMNNRGIEIAVNNRNISARDLTWDTGLILSYNKNEIVDMYFPAPYTPAEYVYEEYAEGYPAGALFSYKWAGLDPADGAARVFNSEGEKVRTREDISDIAALSYMGTTSPPWSLSMTNLLRFRDFELSFMFISNLGHKMRNDTYTQTDYRFTSNLHNDFDKRWRNPGDETSTNIPSFYKMEDAANRDGGYTFLANSDINVLDASYIKLRDISVSYSIPQKLSQKINCKKVKLRVQANNLLTFTFNNEGIDPESFSLRYGSRYNRYKPSVSASIVIEF